MRNARFGVLACWSLCVIANASTFAGEFHVSPSGSPQGKGTQAEPWDLATALAATDKVGSGDTLWLHGGTYRGGFVSQLSGKPDQPIVVRGVAGERVTIDARPRDEKDNALFSIVGSDAIYRDFEVTCTDPLRVTKLPGPWPADIRRGSVDVRADRVSLVNLVLHDLGSGVGFWGQGEGGEVSGCLIYYNGWQGPDRGHGHAVYAQNLKGTKRIINNIIFHQFGYGIHVYGSSKASLKGFEIAGNFAFENGCLSGKDDHSPGIMVGGESPAERIVVRDNVTVGGGIRLGYPWGTMNEDCVVTGNYSDYGLVVRDFRQAIVSKNTVSASSTVIGLEAAERLSLAGHHWSENEFYVTDGRWGECAIVEQGKSRGMSYADWRRETGLDAGSTFTKGTPMKQLVIVRPNAYEPGRANVAVINSAAASVVPVNLDSVLKPGQAFRLVSAQDFYGPAVVEGRYDGKAISVPMTARAVPLPVGMPDVKLPVTEPQFAAFVVLPGEAH